MFLKIKLYQAKQKHYNKQMSIIIEIQNSNKVIDNAKK